MAFRMRSLGFFLAVFLGAPVLASVGTWFIYGGEHGVVNLPAARRMMKSSWGVSPSYFRFGHRFTSAQKDIKLVFPENMPAAVAFFNFNGISELPQFAKKEIRLPGRELVRLRQTGVDRVSLLLRGVNGVVNLVIVLRKGGRDVCEVLVE